jgi:hypothetical protein
MEQGGESVETLLLDIRYGVRAFVKMKGLTAAVLALASGKGSQLALLRQTGMLIEDSKI